MTTHYHSASRGPVEIASMRYEHALNARGKLAREDKDGLRKPELDALAAHIAGIEADFEEAKP
jgi:hypothetical protein